MSERYTRKDAEQAFERLCTVTGHRPARSWNDHGAWQLDYAACYGGFVVNEILADSGGVTQPFGPRRRTAREFVDAVRFAVDAARATIPAVEGVDA